MADIHRIKLNLITNFPHIKSVGISFIEKPTFDYVLKPVGGEHLGLDINTFPGLAPFIRDQVHANLGPMMYDPNVFTIDLQALLSGTPLDSAIGVLKVHVLEARGLKATKLMNAGPPDPYVTIALGAKPALSKTTTIISTSNPSFDQTFFLLVNKLDEALQFSVFDFNERTADTRLGLVSREIHNMEEDGDQEGIVSKIIGDGKDKGELRYDLFLVPGFETDQVARRHYGSPTRF